MRTFGPRRRPSVRSPGSRPRSVCTCQGLRPRGTGGTLALTRTPVLPSAVTKASASRLIISRLNGWPMQSPADASSPASRPKTHGSGPVRIATPSLQWTCTTYSLPVSRRTVNVIPARFSTARRSTGRSVRAEVRRRDACTRGRHGPCRAQLSPSPRRACVREARSPAARASTPLAFARTSSTSSMIGWREEAEADPLLRADGCRTRAC